MHDGNREKACQSEDRRNANLIGEGKIGLLVYEHRRRHEIEAGTGLIPTRMKDRAALRPDVSIFRPK